MELSPSVGFYSFDRMFPTSDYLPKGGVGNLILLPLQGEKAKNGTTLFVDINFLPLPLPEQLSYLASIPKIMEAEIDLILKGKRDAYNYGPLPKSLRSLTKLSREDFPEALVYEDKGEIAFSKAGFSKEAIRYLERVASLPNPQYYERQRKRMPLFVAGEPVLPRFLHLDRQDETFISFPRGMREDLHRLFEMVNLKTVKKDLRNKGKPIEVAFKVALRPEQEEALEAMLKKENGLLEARTSFGKTVLAIALIAKLKVNSLIVVPNISLLAQWKEKLETFLDIEGTVLKGKTIRFGEYHGAKKRLTGKVDVASIDSLTSEEGKKLLSQYGLILFDEAHHLGAVTYGEILRSCSSRYLYGLTATLKRSDGMDKVVSRLIGETLYASSNSGNEGMMRLLHPRFTHFSLSSIEKTLGYSDLISRLILDKERNEMVLKDVEEAYKKGKRSLVLSERVEHVDILKNGLNLPTKDIFVLTGSTKKEEKEAVLEAISTRNGPYVVLASSRYVGEGFDEPNLDTLFLVTPFRWQGLLQQYVGRIHRKKEGKNLVEVYDYIDIKTYLFVRMYQDRLRGHRKEGYVLLEEEANIVRRLYSRSEYKEVLSLDLREAKKNVMLFLSYFETPTLLGLLEEISVKTYVYSHLDVDIVRDNLLIKKLPHPPVNMAVIDERILCFGSINPFIASPLSKVDESLMRIEDKALCLELIREAIKG